MTAVDAYDEALLLGALEEAERTGDPRKIADLSRLLSLLAGWEPLYYQRPPPEHLWSVWLTQAGRGIGKSDGAASYFDSHMTGPPCDKRVPGGHRGGIFGPTFTDTIDSCYAEPQGLKAHNPDLELITKKGNLTIVRWPNGAEARIFGAYTPEDAERPRSGGNRCLDWFEEWAIWRQIDTVAQNAELGRRLGPMPRTIISTTPKNREAFLEMNRRAEAWMLMLLFVALGWQGWEAVQAAVPTNDRVWLSKARTKDNPYLSPEFRAALYARYPPGTRLHRQELEGEIVDDLGTVFQRAWFGYRDGWGDGSVKVRYWDLAGSEPTLSNDDPDWTAGVRLTANPSTREVNVDDLVHFRASSGEVERRVIETAQADGPQVWQVVEQDPGQAGKAQAAHYQQALAGIAPFEAIAPTGSKLVRAQLTVLYAEQGRLSLTRAPWNPVFLDEHEDFTEDDSHDHDDIVDACSGAVAWVDKRMAGAAVALSPIGRLPQRLGPRTRR
jgi:predicted phage terminase large subunit-like protein